MKYVYKAAVPRGCYPQSAGIPSPRAGFCSIRRSRSQQPPRIYTLFYLVLSYTLPGPVMLPALWSTSNLALSDSPPPILLLHTSLSRAISHRLLLRRAPARLRRAKLDKGRERTLRQAWRVTRSPPDSPLRSAGLERMRAPPPRKSEGRGRAGGVDLHERERQHKAPRDAERSDTLREDRCPCLGAGLRERRDETCPVSTGGGTRRVQSVREGGGGGGLPERQRTRRQRGAQDGRAPSGPARLTRRRAARGGDGGGPRGQMPRRRRGRAGGSPAAQWRL